MAFYFRYEYFGLKINFKGEFTSSVSALQVLMIWAESGWYLNDNVLKVINRRSGNTAWVQMDKA